MRPAFSAAGRGRLGLGILTGLAAAAFALALDAGGALDGWERGLFDWRASVLARPGAATDRILLVLVDQESLDWAREENGIGWPWPRETYAAVVDFCRRGGAVAVGLDILFTEPSIYGVADDEALGSSLRAFGPTVAASFLTGEGKPPSGGGDLTAGLTEKYGSPLTFGTATRPIPEVGQNITLAADTHLRPDSDGVYRRIPIATVLGGEAFPSLGPAVWLAAHPEARLTLSEGRIEAEGLFAPLDGNGAAILRYRGASGTYPALRAAAVVQSEARLRDGKAPPLDPSAVEGKYVLIGFAAPGLFDQHPAPTGGTFTGVEVHATALDNWLSGDFLRPSPPSAGRLFVVVLCLAAALGILLWGNTAGKILIGGTALIAAPVGAFAAYGAGWWFPLAAPWTGAGTACLLGLGASYAVEGRRRRFLKNAFSRYLSPAVIEEILRDPGRLALGGERRLVTLFFADLEGFTALSERIAPETLTAFLNEYLSAVTEVILDEDGTVDKYVGDAVVAFWNAPLDTPGHAHRAVSAALRCRERVASLAPRLRERIGAEPAMRIGIHTGFAVVGNMGSATRFDYTALGDAVNLASRLEGANKLFGSRILVSAATREAVGQGFVFRRLGRVSVVGREEPVELFEPIVRAGEEGLAGIEAFEAALAFYEEGRFTEAAEAFARLAPGDPPAAAYETRCRALAAAPPHRWGGVWNATEKG
jgi:adenylate cyclase